MSASRSGGRLFIRMPAEQSLEDGRRSRIDSRVSFRAGNCSSSRGSRIGSDLPAADGDAAAASDKYFSLGLSGENRNSSTSSRSSKMSSTSNGNKQPVVVADPPGRNTSSSSSSTATTTANNGNGGGEMIDLAQLEEGRGGPAPPPAVAAASFAGAAGAGAADAADTPGAAGAPTEEYVKPARRRQ